MQPTYSPSSNAPRLAGGHRRAHRFPWREHLVVLIEHKRLGLAAFLAVVVATVFWTYLQTPIYRATATIQMDSEPMKVLNIEDVLNPDLRDEAYINTQVKLLQSRTLCEQVVGALQLDKNSDFMATAGGDPVGAVQACLSVEPVRDSRLVEVHVDHPNPKLAAMLADGVAQQFIKQNLDRKLTATMNAVHWLREQAEETRAKLEKSEAALAQYRQRAQTVSLEERQNIVVDKLKELSDAVTQAQKVRLAAESDWLSVKRLLDAGTNVTEIAAINADPKVAALRQQLNEKQIALAVLRKRYREHHPSMVAVETELKAITDKLTAACNDAVATLQSNYSMAKAKEDALQQALKQQEQEALEMDRKQPDYNTLKRDAEADRQIYDAILTRIKETSVTGKLEASNARLVDPVQVPGQPFKPRKTRNFAVGIIVGLGAAVGLSFLVNSFEDRVKSYEDIEALGLPLLSGVPHMQLMSRSQSGRVLQLDPQSVCAEAFRNLRASISLRPEVNAAKPLLVTSTARGEGKSVVSANLAIAFAANNQRTLLIDCDMHHPAQHQVFPTASNKGLSVYLIDHLKLEDVVQSTDIPNLDVLQAGEALANTPELLASDRVHELIGEACRDYDRVIIDSPPVTGVSDPLVLLPHVQGVIYVIGFSKIGREIVARSMQKLRECGAPLVGVVMNNIDQQLHGYYYYPYKYSYYHKKGKRNGAE
ncbi:MAG TPA: polysaccharide biosynthesis tyrosine autokinase [Verrucomicrobiae bacterium]|nr:polysaccharide biosynthesis tyrosine autokinase [Verrucomicrobiae bacterium]